MPDDLMNDHKLLCILSAPVVPPGIQNPCRNGGYLNQQLTACVCVNGYTGSLCQTRKCQI